MQKFPKKMFFSIVFVLILFPFATVFAEGVGEEASPKFFYLLEVFGSLISILALIALLKSALLLGGAFGRTFKLFSVSLALITFSLIWRAYLEISGNERFLYEVIFELPIYIGLLIMFISSILLRKVLLGKLN
jgi:hypothetical protein